MLSGLTPAHAIHNGFTVVEDCHGLPVTLKQMGIVENVEEKIKAASQAACAEGETIHNMPFKVTSDMVYAANITADRLGTKYLKRK